MATISNRYQLIEQIIYNILSVFFIRGAALVVQLIIVITHGKEELGDYFLSLMLVNTISASVSMPIMNYAQTFGEGVGAKRISSVFLSGLLYFILSTAAIFSLHVFMFSGGLDSILLIVVLCSLLLALEGGLTGFLVLNDKAQKISRISMFRGLILVGCALTLSRAEDFNVELYFLLYSAVLILTVYFLSRAMGFKVKPVNFSELAIDLRKMSPMYLSFFMALSSIWMIVKGVEKSEGVAVVGVFGFIFALSNVANSLFQGAGLTLIKRLNSQDRIVEFANAYLVWGIYSFVFAFLILLRDIVPYHLEINMALAIVISSAIVSLKQGVARTSISHGRFYINLFAGAIVFGAVLYQHLYIEEKGYLSLLGVLIWANTVSLIWMVVMLRDKLAYHYIMGYSVLSIISVIGFWYVEGIQ